MIINVTLQGITPLLMNRFTEAAEVAVSGGTAATLRGDKGTPREQAEPKRYVDAKSGALYIPGQNVFASIIAAGTFHKVGKRQLTTQKSSLIPAGLLVDNLICPLVDAKGKPIKTWEVDSRSVVIPSTGGRIMCHRPRIDDWFLEIVLELDTAVFHAKLIRAVLDDSGKKIGLGDFRPARKGPFGRFVVVKWAEKPEAKDLPFTLKDDAPRPEAGDGAPLQ
jgi:hypothetical protein